jgi:hypothetical protein
MVINVSNGEIKLDDCAMVVHSGLTPEQFAAGNFKGVKHHDADKNGYVRHAFHGNLDHLQASFWIYFRFGKLQQLHLSFSDTEKLSIKDAEQWMNDWLQRLIGQPPPYEYNWGCISAGTHPKTDQTMIKVSYRDSILNLGFKDVETYYGHIGYERERSARLRSQQS